MTTRLSSTEVPEHMPMARTEVAATVKARTKEEEVWAIQVPGTVSLRVTQNNRLGAIVEASLVIGPNRAGQQFRIQTSDREENQAAAVSREHDPFLNGMLVRIDQDQQADPITRSTDALGTEQLLDIYELAGDEFKARVETLGELALRRLAEVGESMDCSHLQISFVRELMQERYSKGGPQTTMDTGERMSS
jgi:hypothetical protein